MRNIINWTLGGFFRSIGRILSFIVIGGLLAFLLSKSGLRLPTWLTPMYIVKADTITSWTTQQARVQTTHDGTDSWTSWTNISGDNAIIFSNLSNPVKAIAWRVKTNNGMSNLNVYSFRFSYKPTPDAIHPSSYYMQNDTTGEQEEITCTITRNESSGYYWYDCSFQPQTSYTSSDYLYIKINFTLSYLTEMRMSMRGYDERKGTNAVITEQTNNIITNNEQNTQEIIDNLTQANEQLIQSIQDNNYACKIYDKDSIKTDNKYLAQNGTEGSSTNYGISDYININNGKITPKVISSNDVSLCFYNSEKTLINCMSNTTMTLNTPITIPNNAYYIRFTIRKNTNAPQLEVCINGNQAINDILSDTDTSQDSNDASNFFHNFNLSLEGPVSQIVLLPINVLQYLIVDYNSNSTHPPLCTTLKGQQVCLPSGDIIWKRSGCHDNLSPFGCPNFSQFRSFMQLVVGGFIYYKLLRRLVKAVEKGLDPQESGVNLMKL